MTLWAKYSERLKAAGIPDAVVEVCERFREHEHRAWVVGGCVRDLLMGRNANDWDLATTALPDEVEAIFRRTIPTGIAHGTITVVHRKLHMEVTTLRGDETYSDGRRPDSVAFVTDIEEDLARRDFTVNAIAYDPLEGALSDPFGGLKDLEAQKIVAVGVPRERFEEDGLRVLRAARFCATLGFSLDEATKLAIAPSLPTFKKVSPERVHQEWKKALRSEEPSRAYRVMRETGILEVSAAEIDGLDESPFEWTMQRLDRLPKAVNLRLAGLLVDVPEPARAAEALIRRLRGSNAERRDVVHWVREYNRIRDHWLRSESSPSDLEARRLLHRLGRQHVEAIMALAQADVPNLEAERLPEMQERVQEIVASGVPLSIGELPLKGADVMSELSIAPSRAVGEILGALFERCLCEPTLATPQGLRGILDEVAKPILSERQKRERQK